MSWLTGRKLQGEPLRKCPPICLDANCVFSFDMLKVSIAGFPWKVQTGLVRESHRRRFPPLLPHNLARYLLALKDWDGVVTAN